MKLELFGQRDAACVWKKKGEASDSKKTIPTVKHGGESITLWGRFSASGMGNPLRVERTIRKVGYMKVFERKPQAFSSKTRSRSSFCFQT